MSYQPHNLVLKIIYWPSVNALDFVISILNTYIPLYNKNLSAVWVTHKNRYHTGQGSKNVLAGALLS
jgi:hypothetical protein